jgi:hypothetical protein
MTNNVVNINGEPTQEEIQAEMEAMVKEQEERDAKKKGYDLEAMITALDSRGMLNYKAAVRYTSHGIALTKEDGFDTLQEALQAIEDFTLELDQVAKQISPKKED